MITLQMPALAGQHYADPRVTLITSHGDTETQSFLLLLRA
jgi:hypothetical protein